MLKSDHFHQALFLALKTWNWSKNDIPTEDGQGELTIYKSRNNKNKRLKRERRQLELEVEEVEPDLLRQLPGNQQEDVLRLLTIRDKHRQNRWVYIAQKLQ